MNKVYIDRGDGSIDYDRLPAGGFAEIIDAMDRELIGGVVWKPYCTNQAAVVFNRPKYASPDTTSGVKRVRQLKSGDSFTVVLS